MLSFLTAVILLLSSFSPLAVAASRTALTIAIVVEDTPALYPLMLNERDLVSVADLVYDGLFELDDDGYPQKNLLEDYAWVGDGKKLNLTLRAGITFHNGKPLTSRDVCATLDQILLLSGYDEDRKTDLEPEERGLYYSVMNYVDSWEMVDDLTVQITPTRSYMGLLYALTFPILCADEVAFASPAGTGAYKIEEYDPSYRLWLSYYSGWWQRAPQVVDIVANIYADADAALDAFEYQNADIAMTRSLSASRYSGSLNSYSLTYRTDQLEVMLINHGQKMFQDVQVRNAMVMAIDRESIIKSVYQNMAIVANTPIISGTWLYEEEAKQAEYNPTAAKFLLQESGWLLAGDGFRYKNGEVLGFRILTYDEPGGAVRRNAAANIVEMLKAVGVKATYLVWPYGDVKAKLKSGDYHMVLCAYNMDISPDPSFMLNSTFASAYTRYRSETMSDYLKALRKAYKAEDFEAAFSDVQNLFVEDVPFICLYWRTGAILSRDAFTDARAIRELELFRGVEDWQY